ncbi:hypothetical protein [Caudoviricetes sp.]|nr:hypothetical protein [Caudoviricetes sp.]
MAHYAYLDENNIVTKVIVGPTQGADGKDWEQEYSVLHGVIVKQTSYNTRGGVYYIPNTNTPDPDQSKAFRKNFAGIEFIYDPVLDAFMPPQPYPSWLLNTQTCLWDPPIPCPGEGYIWDEATLSWVKNEN